MSSNIENNQPSGDQRDFLGGKIHFYLDPLGREMVEIPSFKGRKKFPFDDKVVHGFLLRLMVERAAETGHRITGPAAKILIESCRPYCHEVGVREEAGDWREAELEQNPLAAVLHIKSQQIITAVVKSAAKWQQTLTTLARKEKLDSSGWAKVQENVFSRKMRACIEPLADLHTTLEKLTRDKHGSRWRLWPAGERPPAAPSSTPQSTPTKTIESKTLRQTVPMSDEAGAVVRYLSEKHWEDLLDEDRGMGCRHVLLVGPQEATSAVSAQLLDRGEGFRYGRFVGADLTRNIVLQAQCDLEGYPERILLLVEQVDQVRPEERESLTTLLNWTQATCVCTATDVARLPEELQKRFSWWLVCDANP